MSNLARRQAAHLSNGAGRHRPRPKISRVEQLRTLRSYLRLGNSNLVGEELGITGSAVRDRLYALDVPLRPRGAPGALMPQHQQDVIKERINELEAMLQ